LRDTDAEAAMAPIQRDARTTRSHGTHLMG
jgi:hypothetical protein